MLNRSEFSEARRQQLSSLMDGDLPDGEAARACILWRQDMATRQDWHAYHLIGDVLRSDDLAARPVRDENFLQALRLRLANEPVPFAPEASPVVQAAPVPQVANGLLAAPVRQAAARGRSWLVAPVAVAAGFVAVAGVMVVTRTVAPEPTAAVLAAAGPTATIATTTSVAAAKASAMLVRDAQLDRYLSAHRSLANGAMPGAEHRVHIVFQGQ